MMLRRRGLMAMDHESKFLRHWWCGEDALSDGVLRDRMGTDFGWRMTDAVTWDGRQYHFAGDPTSYGLATVPIYEIDLGHHFTVYLDGDLAKPDVGDWSSFFDIGSVQSANKNIGFSTNLKGTFFNWKMLGNESDPGLYVNKVTNYPSELKLSGNGWNTVEATLSILDKGNGYDKGVVSLNGYEYTYSCNVPKVRYTDFYQSNEKINTAILGGGTLIDSFGNLTTKLRLRNLKIYVYD